MSADPVTRARQPQDSPRRLSRDLIRHLEQTPGFRTSPGAHRNTPAAATPWAALWLAGTTAGIALPLALHGLGDARTPVLARGSGRGASQALAADAGPLGMRRTSTAELLSSATAQPAVPGQPATTTEALVAAFSALPSPFASEPAPSPQPESGAPTQVSGQRMETPPRPFESLGGAAARLGGALSLADRLSTPLQAFRSTAPGPRIEADTADPLAQRWSRHLQSLVNSTPLVLPVEIVRVRSGAVDQARTIPMALWPDGSATTNVEAPGQAGQKLAEDWVRQQPALAEGSVRPVVMVIEPEATPVATPASTAAPSRAEMAPPAPEPAWTAPAAAAAPAPQAPQPEPAASEAAAPAAAAAELSSAAAAVTPLP